MEIVFATNNLHKLQEISALLGDRFRVLGLRDLGLAEEIPEDHETLEENASQKAWYVFNKTGRSCFADDTGLEVDSLNGAPGVYSARYAPDDSQRMARLLLELGDTPYRSAALVSALAVADPSGSLVLEAEGICRGEILSQPVASPGYGYNRLLHVREAGCTLAEMPPHQLEKLGSRAKALRSLAVDLPRVLGLNVNGP